MSWCLTKERKLLSDTESLDTLMYTLEFWIATPHNTSGVAKLLDRFSSAEH